MDGLFWNTNIDKAEILKSFQSRQDICYGERRLLTAVMLQAIEDLNPTQEATGYENVAANKARVIRSATHWFKSPSDSFNSFIGICEMLNMCPDTARRRIFNGKGGKR